MQIALNALFLANPMTGTGQYTTHLLNGLRRAGDSVRALAPQGTAGHDLTSVATPLGKGNVGKLWFEQVGVPRAAAGCTVLHYPYFAGPLSAAAPLVMTIHDIIPLLFPEYQTTILARGYNRLIGLAARRAAAIIADSEHSRQDVIRMLGIDPRRVHVVYLAAGEGLAPVTDEGTLASVRRRYALEGDYILYNGGLNRHKNVEMLLRAFAGVVAAGQPCTLAITGAEHTENQAVYPDVRAAGAALGEQVAGAVRFLGRVPDDDLTALYSAATVFAYPSRYEGFGLAPLEAMACGAPVVCSRAASLPEVVGGAALLVDPDDEAAMASALLRLLQNEGERAELRRRGLAQATRFSWGRTVAETMAIYRQVGG